MIINVDKVVELKVKTRKLIFLNVAVCISEIKQKEKHIFKQIYFLNEKKIYI